MPITKTVALLVTITAFALVGHAVAAETAGFSEADKPVSADTKPASSGPVVVPDDRMQSLRRGDTYTAAATGEERDGFPTRLINAVKDFLERIGMKMRFTYQRLYANLENSVNMVSSGDLDKLNIIPSTDIEALLSKKKPSKEYNKDLLQAFDNRDKAIRNSFDEWYGQTPDSIAKKLESKFLMN